MALHLSHQYFKIAKPHEEYHGRRYFRITVTQFEVLQIVLSPGSESRRGRSNNMGMYLISQSTFYSNYLPYGYAVPCTEKEFFNACSDMILNFFPDAAKTVTKKKK